MISPAEIDAFRAELLRQKIVFESELRRQRETYDLKLEQMTRLLNDREVDCRNFQTVITILGRKVDGLSQQVSSMQRDHNSSPIVPSSLNRPPSPSGSRPSSPSRPFLSSMNQKKILSKHAPHSPMMLTFFRTESLNRAPSNSALSTPRYLSRENSPSARSLVQKPKLLITDATLGNAQRVNSPVRKVNSTEQNSLQGTTHLRQSVVAASQIIPNTVRAVKGAATLQEGTHQNALEGDTKVPKGV